MTFSFAFPLRSDESRHLCRAQWCRGDPTADEIAHAGNLVEQRQPTVIKYDLTHQVSGEKLAWPLDSAAAPQSAVRLLCNHRMRKDAPGAFVMWRITGRGRSAYRT